MSAAILSAGLLFAGPVFARGEQPGNFDYWTLVLSWSPTYCASKNGRTDKSQCGAGRRYAFVVHGLWPQYNRGWPSWCARGKSWVPEKTVRAMLDIMPSRSLVIHEWKKHGTCSGLRPQGYFGLTRKLFSRLRIPARYLAPSTWLMITPAQLRHDFRATNLWLKDGMISVHCGNRRDRANLREVRLCFDRDLKPTDCGQNSSRQCRAKTLVMPPVR